VTLRPVLFEELEAFNVRNLEERLFRGGLPPALLVQEHDPEFYSEWMDSYFARDVQELFHLEKRNAFLKCLRLLLRQSGGLIDLSSVASDTSAGYTGPKQNTLEARLRLWPLARAHGDLPGPCLQGLRAGPRKMFSFGAYGLGVFAFSSKHPVWCSKVRKSCRHSQNFFRSTCG
jgi:hypothetical protein